MSSLVVWCMITVAVDSDTIPFFVETAVKGRVVNSNSLYYFVDFSEYAKKRKYMGEWSESRMVFKDNCVEDKK